MDRQQDWYRDRAQCVDHGAQPREIFGVLRSVDRCDYILAGRSAVTEP